MDTPIVAPESSPLQSKRFVAYLIADVTWAALILAVLLCCRGSMSPFVWAALLALTLVRGFVQALYIGGQASIDSYVRLATIAANAGVKLEHGKLTIHGAADDAAPPAAP